MSSNPISSNNKNMHLKNNNNKKDNYNSRDNKILNDPDVRMMMGPYKVRENNNEIKISIYINNILNLQINF